MSVNRGDENQQAPAGSAVFGESFNKTGGAQAAGAAQASAPAASRGFARGLSRINQARTGMGRKRPAADLEELQKTFNEEFGRFSNNLIVPEAQNFKLIVVDRQRLGKKVDLLLGILPVQLNGALHVAIHTMLLEDANDAYEPYTLQIAGKTSRVTTVVGDVYDSELWATIVDVVAEVSGHAITPYDAGHQTLPSEMDVKDKDAVHRIAFFVSEALTRTALANINQTTADVISLTDLGTDVVASATIDYKTVDDHTAGGLPLISQFDVKLRYSEGARAGESQVAKAFDLGSQQPLGGASGFVDLSYQPPAQAGFGQPQATQFYWAHIILTRLDTDQDVITPELQTLSLLGSTLIARNLHWARVWSPNFRGKSAGALLNNLGAIGYELPTPDGNSVVGPIDTTSAAFDDGALARLVMTTIRPNPIMQIDVEESGELSWLNRTLIDAASGNTEANNSIITAFDNLTAGGFSRRFGNDQLVRDDNRIHLGYYVDEAGEKRDIRHLNYLAVLGQFGDTDPLMAEKWQATFDNVEIDEAVRLADREDLIRKILGPTVRIHGYARRLTWHPNALESALEAAAEAGLRIRPENITAGFGVTAQRGRADLEALAFGGQGGRQVFTYGGNSQQGRAFGRAYTGRGGAWR